jgi:hypothetical protein
MSEIAFLQVEVVDYSVTKCFTRRLVKRTHWKGSSNKDEEM